MKITLEYEDEKEALTALNGWLYKRVLWELNEWLRSQIKHCDKDELLPAREKLHELLQDDNLSIYD